MSAVPSAVHVPVARQSRGRTAAEQSKESRQQINAEPASFPKPDSLSRIMAAAPVELPRRIVKEIAELAKTPSASLFH
jgi:hypothetical protein